jgi:hypothetical protein
MFQEIYGSGDGEPAPNRAQRRARERRTKSQQRRAQRAYNRKVKAAQRKEG